MGRDERRSVALAATDQSDSSVPIPRMLFHATANIFIKCQNIGDTFNVLVCLWS
jgi:hypothetical protein